MLSPNLRPARFRKRRSQLSSQIAELSLLVTKDGNTQEAMLDTAMQRALLCTLVEPYACDPMKSDLQSLTLKLARTELATNPKAQKEVQQLLSQIATW